MDLERATAAVRELLIAVGEDPDRPGLAGTPDRVARAYAEVFAGLDRTATDALTTSFDLGHHELVIVRDIPTFSTCEHHLAPFHGRTHVAYLPGPDGRVVGLSKIARLVDVFAQRPQVQERLTQQIADALMADLGAAGALVVISCEHLCMTMRGVRKAGATTVTLCHRGVFSDSVERRREVLDLIGPQDGRAR